jgi:hypothetical protein
MKFQDLFSRRPETDGDQRSNARTRLARPARAPGDRQGERRHAVKAPGKREDTHGIAWNVARTLPSQASSASSRHRDEFELVLSTKRALAARAVWRPVHELLLLIGLLL